MWQIEGLHPRASVVVRRRGGRSRSSRRTVPVRSCTLRGAARRPAGLALRAGFDKHLGGLEITQARRRIGKMAGQVVTGGLESREQADRWAQGFGDLKTAQIGSEAFARSQPDLAQAARAWRRPGRLSACRISPRSGVGIRLESV